MKKLILFLALPVWADSLPSMFDLRNDNGVNNVSAVKSQSGGTCWTHSVMASMEGNLMKTGVWKAQESGEANLAEYHLDWWNGFNTMFNGDFVGEMISSGLSVHNGGDYRVASAYLSRGPGAVRDIDGQSFSSPPQKHSPSYHYYYTRDIEWFSVGNNLENISKMKEAIAKHGVVGTALAWSSGFYMNNTFYQPKSSTMDANHAVAIVGWDDNKQTNAPDRGAWLVKNSWGTSWGNGGYFWISYYDKVAGLHPEMGSVSFQNTERMKYNAIYAHDHHGWRDTKAAASEAFNAFTAKGGPNGSETIKAVSFYTAADNVDYKIEIYRKYEGGQLSGLLSQQAGNYANSGFHTVDLKNDVRVSNGDKFYVYVKFSKGGHPFDRTSDVPVLLGASSRVIVPSKAKPGESYYKSGSAWKDLTQDDQTANFCIKALTTY